MANFRFEPDDVNKDIDPYDEPEWDIEGCATDDPEPSYSPRANISAPPFISHLMNQLAQIVKRIDNLDNSILNKTPDILSLMFDFKTSLNDDQKVVFEGLMQNVESLVAQNAARISENTLHLQNIAFDLENINKNMLTAFYGSEGNTNNETDALINKLKEENDKLRNRVEGLLEGMSALAKENKAKASHTPTLTERKGVSFPYLELRQQPNDAELLPPYVQKPSITNQFPLPGYLQNMSPPKSGNFGNQDLPSPIPLPWSPPAEKTAAASSYVNAFNAYRQPSPMQLPMLPPEDTTNVPAYASPMIQQMRFTPF